MSTDVVTPGDHTSSILYDRIIRDNADAGDMPPGNAELSQVQIDLIAQWIDEGALPEESSDIVGCTDSNAITCDDGVDSTYFPECDTCSNNDPTSYPKVILTSPNSDSKVILTHRRGRVKDCLAVWQ